MYPGLANKILNCEKDGKALPYAYSKIQISSGEKDVFVISDLHIAEGKRKDGNYSGTENFYADGAFQRFIFYLLNSIAQKDSLLIINGDFIDFLRIISIPETDGELTSWLKILNGVGITTLAEGGITTNGKAISSLITTSDLKNSIVPKEKKFGLKTNEFKSIFKLAIASTGHTEVFDALALWLKEGNRLIISKGNHDLEWIWTGVRNYLRLNLAERIAQMSDDVSEESIDKILEEIIFKKLQFIDNSLIIDKEFYIEHGQCFDKFSNITGKPLLGDKKELNIPFGSFFNRYLINHIELHYPFFDNIRPRENLLPMLFKKNFPLGIKVLFFHIPFVIRTIPKKYYSYMFNDFLVFLLAVCLPVLISIGLIIYPYLDNISSLTETTEGASGIWGTLHEQGFNLLKLFGGSALSYFLTRIVSYFKLEEPDYLDEDACNLLEKNLEYKFVTLGHTHNPQQIERKGKWYYNTGTWIPIVETASASLREDKTYTFLHMKKVNGSFKPGVLLRWNDDALRAEPLILVCPKD